MGQAGTDSSAHARPLSPHLQIWRWHITMAASILTRATGVALYAGLLIVVLWAASLASGPYPYSLFLWVMGSVVGKLILFGITVSIFYHMAAGVRHLVFDSGRGFEPKTANMSAALCIAFGVVASLAVWAVALVTGAL